MKENILIVEDEYVLANDLRLMLEQAGHSICAIVDTIEDAKEAVRQYRPTWVLLDILLHNDAMGTDLAVFLTERNVGFIYVSASTNQEILELAKQTHPDGFLVKPVRERDLLMMLDIARNKHRQHTEVIAQREMSVQNQIRQIIDSNLESAHTLELVPAAFQSLVPFDFMYYEFFYPATNLTKGNSFLRIGFNEYQVISNQDLPKVLNKPKISVQRQALRPFVADDIHNQPSFDALLEVKGLENALHHRYDIRSYLPFVITLGSIGVRLAFYNKRYDAYSAAHLSLLSAVQRSLTDLFYKLHNFDTSFAGGSGSRKKVALSASLSADQHFRHLIGNSPVWLRVLDDMQTVAHTPVSVLVLGESGTGKELVAKSIHELSSRRARPFIVVNCATLPAALIESELFGHEKGAFTGASDKRIGKFEMADGGTLFLDEIGEMPMPLQGKLLRVLQEKELEYIGGSKTVKVDVRVIAATNKHLEKEVAEGRFRLDLFFRLNVFPIALPPLRERKEDIPLLSVSFLEQIAIRIGRLPAPVLSAAATRKLQAYQWPGNIRELENLMERLLIRCKNNTISETDLPELKNTMMPEEQEDQTLSRMEAEHIITILKKCNGKVFGVGGAAEILGLPGSTLASRIKKLGIKKDTYFRQ
ncbi:sigma-54 dependent transcriptional regulator [Chitinophaga agri]|uniref:Response regulator n=1 Tax=Chitinophaga agri TaxID=2703787 RepID=A0A6B9ZC60_9BACT|nr:sigma 54-interacting transcriptional regulator [Chitinophaga agri]QHS59706.1 response regulator [Chitinophaga agri]